MFPDSALVNCRTLAKEVTGKFPFSSVRFVRLDVDARVRAPAVIRSSAHLIHDFSKLADVTPRAAHGKLKSFDSTQQFTTPQESAVRVLKRIATCIFSFGLIVIAAACVVEPREGYWDRDHDRWYHDHAWHECMEEGSHCH